MKNVPITVLIPVMNEEANIGSCLRSVSRAEYVIVIDSNSADSTRSICRDLGAEVAQFEFKGGYPKKRQWMLSTWSFKTDWVLLLDADERVPDELWVEIRKVIEGHHDDLVAFSIRKEFCFLGRRFRFGGFSHRAISLFRLGKADFEELTAIDCGLDMEVHERLIVRGRTGALVHGVEHWDSRGLHHYLRKHNDYSTWDAAARIALKEKSVWEVWRQFSGIQLCRRLLKLLALRIPGEPILWFLYHYVLCLGLLEGRPGFIASRIRASYIADVRDKMWEADRGPFHNNQ